MAFEQRTRARSVHGKGGKEVVKARKWSVLLAMKMGLVLVLLAGCGGNESQGGSEGEKGLVDRSDIRIEFVGHSFPDPWWTVVHNGADQAAADMGVEMKWREMESYDIVQMQRNLESAIATNPDGLVVSLPDPDALGPLVREAVNKGIPVVAFNSGEDAWQELGVLTYVGQEEFTAGVEAGKRLNEEGLESLLCVNHEQGNAAVEARCAGLEEGFDGDVKQVAVQGTDPTLARNGIETALRQNPDIDAMMTLSASVADQGLKALEASGRSNEVTFATFDLSPTVLRSVRDGDVLFAIDQQQFLQGYLPVQFLVDYIQYGTTPIGTVKTGPAFVTKENAEQVIKLTEQGIR
jgi:simple sugar transport system substrate-binding protein